MLAASDVDEAAAVVYLNVQLARNTPCTGKWSVHAQNDTPHAQTWERFLTTNQLFVISTKFRPTHRGGTATWICRNAAKQGKHKRVTNDYVCASVNIVQDCQQCQVRWAPSIQRHHRVWDHAMIAIASTSNQHLPCKHTSANEDVQQPPYHGNHTQQLHETHSEPKPLGTLACYHNQYTKANP